VARQGVNRSLWKLETGFLPWLRCQTLVPRCQRVGANHEVAVERMLAGLDIAKAGMASDPTVIATAGTVFLSGDRRNVCGPGAISPFVQTRRILRRTRQKRICEFWKNRREQTTVLLVDLPRHAALKNPEATHNWFRQSLRLLRIQVQQIDRLTQPERAGLGI